MSGLLRGWNRPWRRFNEKERERTWAGYMPPPMPQLNLLPRIYQDRPSTWAGTCCVHSYSECMTAILRIWYERRALHDPALVHNLGQLQVDLHALIHCTAGHGVLKKEGSSVYLIGRLVQECGLPVQGDSPDAVPRYAWGAYISDHRAFLLPIGDGATPGQVEAAMSYREHLCACLDSGPVVVFLRLQSHYFHARAENDPYRPRLVYERVDHSNERTWGHCLCVYGYACPSGDVRSLILNYQENALRENAEGQNAERQNDGEPPNLPPRHIIDLDAVVWYFVPKVGNITLSKQPGKAKAATPSTNICDGVRDSLTSFLH